jgi:hypothetical protein
MSSEIGPVVKSSAYGNPVELLVTQDILSSGPLYTGKEFDSRTRTYYFGARFFDDSPDVVAADLLLIKNSYQNQGGNEIAGRNVTVFFSIISADKLPISLAIDLGASSSKYDHY